MGPLEKCRVRVVRDSHFTIISRTRTPRWTWTPWLTFQETNFRAMELLLSPFTAFTGKRSYFTLCTARFTGSDEKDLHVFIDITTYKLRKTHSNEKQENLNFYASKNFVLILLREYFINTCSRAQKSVSTFFLPRNFKLVIPVDFFPRKKNVIIPSNSIISLIKYKLFKK